MPDELLLLAGTVCALPPHAKGRRSSLFARRTAARRRQQLLATRLLRREGLFSLDVSADPRRSVARALAYMTRLGLLRQEQSSYRRRGLRTHPQFPDVDDIVAHQANMLEETIAALNRID